MSAYIESKNVTPLNQNEKEHLQTISFENNLNLNSPPNTNLSSKIETIESLSILKSDHKSKNGDERTWQKHLE